MLGCSEEQGNVVVSYVIRVSAVGHPLPSSLCISARTEHCCTASGYCVLLGCFSREVAVMVMTSDLKVSKVESASVVLINDAPILSSRSCVLRRAPSR